MSDLERFIAQVFFAAVARHLHAVAGVRPTAKLIALHKQLVGARFYISRSRARWAAMMGPETCARCGHPRALV